MILLRVVLFVAGVYLVLVALRSAVRTFVIPRNIHDCITRSVFIASWMVFSLPLRFTKTYLQRDSILAYLAPVALLMLLPVWYLLVGVGFGFIFYSVGVTPMKEAMILSGSSLFTLGSKFVETFPAVFIIFVEAIIGLIMVALLISYLPTMYSSFSKREVAVNLLEIVAGSPPRVTEMLLRYQRIFGMDQLGEIWRTWETWFAELEESHTSHPALIFFRSSPPTQSWLTSAGAVLDAAALSQSAIDTPPDPNARLCIRAGYLALRRVAEHYEIRYPENPSFPNDPITVRREEFDALLDELAQGGVPLKPDREKAWLDYAGWRVNYDAPLVGLAGIIQAPYAPWSSDRLVKS
jgi:hypothetical protein